jgi:hypothetical protein
MKKPAYWRALGHWMFEMIWHTACAFARQQRRARSKSTTRSTSTAEAMIRVDVDIVCYGRSTFVLGVMLLTQ